MKKNFCGVNYKWVIIQNQIVKSDIKLRTCEITQLEKLEHATGIDTSDLSAKKNFIALKTEVDKPAINKLTNVPTN